MSVCTFFGNRDCCGLDAAAFRSAVERRSRYLIESANAFLCYVNRTFGGAYKFSCMAKRRGLQVVNLGRATID